MTQASCSCSKCIDACKRIPGIFHPLEALRAIRAGYADDIMGRWEQSDERSYKMREDWLVLMPRSYPVVPVHNIHMRSDPFYSAGRCVLLNVDERCEIHDSGFKPSECRAALLCDKDNSRRETRNHNKTKAAWRSPVGRHVVRIWKRELEKGITDDHAHQMGRKQNHEAGNLLGSAD